MNEWVLRYDHYGPAQEAVREALCTLGNGYVATRGAGADTAADGVHYPGTYLAGGYNRLVTEVGGRDVENEDLVNFPNWLPLTFRIDGGDWLCRGVDPVAPIAAGSLPSTFDPDLMHGRTARPGDLIRCPGTS